MPAWRHRPAGTGLRVDPHHFLLAQRGQNRPRSNANHREDGAGRRHRLLGLAEGGRGIFDLGKPSIDANHSREHDATQQLERGGRRGNQFKASLSSSVPVNAQ